MPADDGRFYPTRASEQKRLLNDEEEERAERQKTRGAIVARWHRGQRTSPGGDPISLPSVSVSAFWVPDPIDVGPALPSIPNRKGKGGIPSDEEHAQDRWLWW